MGPNLWLVPAKIYFIVYLWLQDHKFDPKESKPDPDLSSDLRSLRQPARGASFSAHLGDMSVSIVIGISLVALILVAVALIICFAFRPPKSVSVHWQQLAASRGARHTSRAWPTSIDASELSTCINLVNNILGAGLFVMPFCLKQVLNSLLLWLLCSFEHSHHCFVDSLLLWLLCSFEHSHHCFVDSLLVWLLCSFEHSNA